MASSAKAHAGLSETVAAIAVIAGLNYAAVGWGYKPYAYCWGRGVLEFTGITAWYQAVTFLTALLAIGVGVTKGFTHALKFLVLLAFLCILPEWLDKGFRLGQTCEVAFSVPLVPPERPVTIPPLPPVPQTGNYTL